MLLRSRSLQFDFKLALRGALTFDLALPLTLNRLCFTLKQGLDVVSQQCLTILLGLLLARFQLTEVLGQRLFNRRGLAMIDIGEKTCLLVKNPINLAQLFLIVPFLAS